jgi:hypothetical protein
MKYAQGLAAKLPEGANGTRTIFKEFSRLGKMVPSVRGRRRQSNGARPFN